MDGVGSVCTELTVWEGKTMKTAVKHCVSSAYQIGTGGGVEGRRGLAPPPIRLGIQTTSTGKAFKSRSSVWSLISTVVASMSDKTDKSVMAGDRTSGRWASAPMPLK